MAVTSYNNIDQFLWKMFSIWLVIDSITGFFLSFGANTPLSQIFKLILLTFVVIRLSKIKNILIYSFICILYISIYFLHTALSNIDFFSPILLLSKFLSLIFFYCYFKFSIRHFPELTISKTLKVFIISWIIIVINIILGLMGLGIPSYGEDSEGMGVKGFFYAANELGGILAVLVPFIVYLIYVRLSGLKAFISYTIVLLTGICIGTKSCILVCLSSIIIVPILYMPPQKRRKTLFFIVLGLCILLPFIINLIMDSSLASIDKWIYSYNKGGILSLIFSGRHEFWETQKEDFFNSNIFIQFFGMGIQGKPIERDHLDSLLMFGYLGLIITVSILFYFLLIAYRNRYNNSLVKVVLFSNILVIGIGYMAGHVWFSAMASLYIALINMFTFVHDKEVIFASSNKKITFDKYIIKENV